METTDRQISTTALWAWIAWVIAIAMTMAATILGIGWADIPRARMVSICIVADAMPVLGAGVCLTMKLLLRHQADRILGILATKSDADRRVRGIGVTQ